MIKENISYDALKKDGSGQSMRKLKALDPSYFQPDERTLKDWLQFIARLTPLLKYEDGQGSGDLTWSAFLDYPDTSPGGKQVSAHEKLEQLHRDIELCLSDPGALQHDARKMEWLSRPHFVLLIAFLKLLEHPRNALNTFTLRHLDFYYRDVLQFTHRAAIPDRVHAVVTLERDVDRFVLPQDTLLDGGTAPSGDPVRLRVLNDFFINKARIADLRSVYLDKEMLDIRAIHALYRDSVKEHYGLWPMLRLVYGSPGSGGVLPLYNGTVVTLDFLRKTYNLLTQPMQNKLSLTEFMELMAARSRAIQGESEAWNVVAYLLTKHGRRLKNDPSFTVRDVNTDNFQTHLWNVLGEIQLTATPEATYEQLLQAERYFLMEAPQVAFVLRLWLVPDPAPSDQDWEEAYRLLESAYENLCVQERMDMFRNINADTGKGFDEMMKTALGNPAPGDPLPVYGTTLEKIHREIAEGKAGLHEAYLREELLLSVKDFRSVMDLKNQQATPEAIAQGYRALERAYRQKRGIVDRPPVVREWRNLYKTADATLCGTTPDAWKPFGMEGYGDKVGIGIAVESPVLALQEGKRVILLTMVFEKDDLPSHVWNSFNKDSFTIGLSSGDAFFSPRKENVEAGPAALLSLDPTGGSEIREYYTLPVRIVLGVDDQAVRPMNSASWSSTYPLIKLTLNEQKDDGDRRIPYVLYKDLRLKSVLISTEVTGMTNVYIENDESKLNPKKPFEPFGSFPLVGSKFSFLNREIVEKKIDLLSLTLEWMGKPDDIAAHYSGYKELATSASNTGKDSGAWASTTHLVRDDGKEISPAGPLPAAKEFSVGVKMVDNRIHYDLADMKLFPRNANAFTATVSPQHPNYTAKVVETDENSSVTDTERYFYLELNAPDFQHTQYPLISAGKALAYAKGKAEDYQVNPPYTPKLKSFSIGYKAQDRIIVGAHAPGMIYRLHPFGVEALGGTDDRNFLPSFEDEGTLYIGLEEFTAPAVLSLYFKLQEGSADPRVSKPSVGFSYLAHDGWKILGKTGIMSDTTNDLSQTGIIQVSIPDDASCCSTLMPPGKHWLRLSVQDNSSGIHDVQGIWTQGIEAVMDSRGEYLNLPAETVTTTAVSVPAVKSLFQPYPSFGGKPEEGPGSFYTRVSERLRHKQRAVNVWDYERIVLQQFPEIYKAKALPCDRDHRQVRLVVIPSLKGRGGASLFEPRFSQAELENIWQYVSRYASPFAPVVVQNPEYLQVKVRVSVRLKNGFDELSSKQSINEALRRNLSPWAFDVQREIAFGGKIYANTIVNFLEAQQSIAYIVGLKFFTSKDGDQFTFVEPGELNVHQVETLTPETILVSAPSHDIDVVRDDLIDHDDMRGIGYMKIELDFKIN